MNSSSTSDGSESGYVSPIAHCPHVNIFLKEAESLSTSDPCAQCKDTSENWVCLTCYQVGCCRFKNAHASAHFSATGHPLALSYADLSIWCYECDTYIKNPKLSKVYKQAHQDKFKSKPGQSTYNITTGVLNEEEIKEYFEEKEVVEQKVKQLAQLIRDCKYMIAYTGAGVSTSAKIPDYRGPKGVWTLQSKGEKPEFEVTMEQALPTPTHMALVELAKRGIMKFLVSTNVDGLHRRSGITSEGMSELHGNCYKEFCANCSKEYLRHFDASSHYADHITGRKCTECGGPLKDSIINFGENLPTSEIAKTVSHVEKSDFSLVLGTSMRVSPANKFPLEAVTAGGKMVIVNLQITPYDKLAHLIIRAPSDMVMQLLCKELEVEIPEYKEEFDEIRNLKI